MQSLGILQFAKKLKPLQGFADEDQDTDFVCARAGFTFLCGCSLKAVVSSLRIIRTSATKVLPPEVGAQ